MRTYASDPGVSASCSTIIWSKREAGDGARLGRIEHALVAAQIDHHDLVAEAVHLGEWDAG